MNQNIDICSPEAFDSSDVGDEGAEEGSDGSDGGDHHGHHGVVQGWAHQPLQLFPTAPAAGGVVEEVVSLFLLPHPLDEYN